MKNKYSKQNKMAKTQYYNSLLNTYKHDMRSLYKTVNSLYDS